MDKVTEEVLSSLITRINSIEEKIKNLSTRSKENIYSSWLATKAQLDLVLSLGGMPDPTWTKKQVSEEIKELKKKRINPKKEVPEVLPESKTLTKKEIKELGEDAFI